MVSSVGIAIAGIIISIFLSVGGVELTRTALAEGKKTIKEIKETLGKTDDDNISQGADRDVENE